MLSEIDRLTAIEEIRLLKARYFRYLDSKKWGEYAALYAPGATMDASQSFYAPHPVSGEAYVNGRQDLLELIMAGSGDMVMTGGEVIASKGRELFPEVITMHHGHMSEITIQSADRANGIWAMEDRLLFLDPGSPIREIQGFGHYHEDYVKMDGEWKIAKAKLTRVRVDIH